MCIKSYICSGHGLGVCGVAEINRSISETEADQGRYFSIRNHLLTNFPDPISQSANLILRAGKDQWCNYGLPQVLARLRPVYR